LVSFFEVLFLTSKSGLKFNDVAAILFVYAVLVIIIQIYEFFDDDDEYE
jgi:hypothetical protein